MANDVAASTPFSLVNLFEDGATFTIDFEKLKLSMEEEEGIEDEITNENVINNLCELMQEEELYNGYDSFEDIAAKMVNITPNGEVKKFIIRHGTGDKMSNNTEVTINYNAYFEYEIEPFDSTYARKKPCRFFLNDGSVIVGLDIGVQSMRLNEKAQFLIAPSYAYGKLGCCHRIPPNATVLFEVELMQQQQIVSGADLEENKTFDYTYKYCERLNAQGKECFTRQQYSNAIRKYNMAREKLESFHLKEYTEQEKQQEFLLKLYTNLIICYTKLEKYQQGCSYANKLYRMVLGSQLQVPAKVYYNNARCLRKLGDFRTALKRLKEARRLSPNNDDIARELIELEEEDKRARSAEAAFAARSIMMSQDKIRPIFKESVKKSCEELKRSKDVFQISIGSELSDDEKKFAESESAKFGFKFKTVRRQDKDQGIIMKTIDVDNM